ncbi:MAG TPA: Virginiamycin B lyase, partial [Ktedonobacteraceae bacterium]|nr:Virginiamycin B lyase [Ktedonobacteraceae bacterium]
GITTGPDGELWFTEYADNQIGRVTLSGKFDQFPIPTAGSCPVDITYGADGRLWFTEYEANQIGRVTVH